MKDFFQSFFHNKTKVAILIAVLAVSGYFIHRHYLASAGPVRYVTAQAATETIVSSISGTGQVSQDRSVDLTPPSAGKLVSVNVKQGDKVKAGQVIATMDERNAIIALNQAKASLASAQASYDQTLAGSTSDDIELSQLNVDSAQQSLDQANQNLQNVTKQQQQSVTTAYNKMLNSGIEAVPSSGNLGTGTVAVSGNYNGSDQGSIKVSIYDSMSGQQFSVSGLTSLNGAVNKTSPITLSNSGLSIQFSGTLYNNDNWTINVPNTTSSDYNSNYNAYQTALTNQTSALQSAQNQIASAQNNLKQAQINLNQKQAPPTNQAAASAKASLLNAQANLQTAELNYDNNILKAPFDGVVAALNNHAGDQVSSGAAVATVVTNQSIAVIPLNEIDVSKVKVGDKATMTFDAIDDLAVSGTVAQIDQIGTVSQGVVNYNVKITFDTEDPRVKPGMSINVSIITDTQADVLAVPSSAVQSQGGSSYVMVIDPLKTQSVAGQTGVTSSEAPTRVMVETGASDDTYTQITGGDLKEGDTIVTQTINPTAAKSTASAATSATNALRLGGGNATFGGGSATFIKGGSGIGR